MQQQRKQQTFDEIRARSLLQADVNRLLFCLDWRAFDEETTFKSNSEDGQVGWAMVDDNFKRKVSWIYWTDFASGKTLDSRWAQAIVFLELWAFVYIWEFF